MNVLHVLSRWRERQSLREVLRKSAAPLRELARRRPPHERGDNCYLSDFTTEERAQCAFAPEDSERHPEIREGECFYGNMTVEEFGRLWFSTKRMGERAYTRHTADYSPGGVYLPMYRPVFLKKEEVEQEFTRLLNDRGRTGRPIR